jgi:hypothetical protein
MSGIEKSHDNRRFDPDPNLGSPEYKSDTSIELTCSLCKIKLFDTVVLTEPDKYTLVL